jgi:hypothetical protein
MITGVDTQCKFAAFLSDYRLLVAFVQTRVFRVVAPPRLGKAFDGSFAKPKSVQLGPPLWPVDCVPVGGLFTVGSALERPAGYIGLLCASGKYLAGFVEC